MAEELREEVDRLTAELDRYKQHAKNVQAGAASRYEAQERFARHDPDVLWPSPEGQGFDDPGEAIAAALDEVRAERDRLAARVTELENALRELLNYGIELNDLRLVFVCISVYLGADVAAREALADGDGRDHEMRLADGRTLFEHLDEWRNAPSNTASGGLAGGDCERRLQ
jgi:hypothetical protein